MTVFVHSQPVWRERANFIIGAKCSKDDLFQDWEQLWSRQIGENRFEICCIPFFVYNLALGDEVETGAEEGKPYMLQRVLKASGRYTFRVWFGKSPNPDCRHEVLETLKSLGCLYEWSSENLLAIDAATDDQAQQAADFLWQKEQQGQLVYETGRV